MTEAQYQAHIIRRIHGIFPGCLVLKQDPQYQQGIPDLVILWKKYWAVLEVKLYSNASIQPNQDYFVTQLNEMSFAAYIYPENEEEVLVALQQAFKPPRRTRISQS